MVNIMRAGSTLARRAHEEQGIALIGVLLLLVIISASTAALAVSGRTEIAISRNHEMATQAQVAAEAGLNHALDVTVAFLGQWQANGFATPGAAMTGLLLGPDDLSGTVATDADNGSLEATGIPRPPGRLTLAGPLGSQYEARIFDDDDPARGVTPTAADLLRITENNQPTTDGNTQIVVQAVGYATDGSMTTLEATIRPVALPAILCNGRLAVGGNPSIDGANGSIHSNDELYMSGNPTISQNATASGAYNVSGVPVIGGYSGGGAPAVPVPPIRAIDYKPQADYILTSAGTMTDQGGAVICNAWADNDACKTAGYMWKFEGASGWNIADAVVGALGDNATYYLEMDAKMSGNPGTLADPLNITIITEGTLEISGNPTLEADTPGLLFVTDKDLVIAGNVTQVGAEAGILVHEQFKMAGNPSSLSGNILIEDAPDVTGLVTENLISGNPSITSSNAGGMIAGFTVTGWREGP